MQDTTTIHVDASPALTTTHNAYHWLEVEQGILHLQGHRDDHARSLAGPRALEART